MISSSAWSSSAPESCRGCAAAMPSRMPPETINLHLKGTAMTHDDNANAGTRSPYGLTRRSLLRSGAALGGLVAGSGAPSGFPMIWAQNIKDVTLRHAGTPVAAIPQIAAQATKDLGFTVTMQSTESVELLNRFLSQSTSIDVGDVSLTFMKYLVGRDVLQAIP